MIYLSETNLAWIAAQTAMPPVRMSKTGGIAFVPQSVAVPKRHRLVELAPPHRGTHQAKQLTTFLDAERRSVAPQQNGMLGLGSLAAAARQSRMSNLPPKADFHRRERNVRFGPCVDGSELARTFFTSAALVGAAMCSAC